jgi:hypothetical protein
MCKILLKRIIKNKWCYVLLPPDVPELEDMTSVVISQRYSNHVIRLQVSVLGVAIVAASFIESVCFNLIYAFDIFTYSLPVNYVIVFPNSLPTGKPLVKVLEFSLSITTL